MVFSAREGPVDLGDWRNWWRWQPGAMWRHPAGPDSTVDDKQNHRFPYDSRGWGGTSPLGACPANAYGLVDLIGNAWEWTGDYYIPRHIRPSDKPVDAGKRQNLLAAASVDQTQPLMPRRVLKGGSQLCSPDYCLRFRPAARSPQAEDTGMSHVGFRCAQDA